MQILKVKTTSPSYLLLLSERKPIGYAITLYFIYIPYVLMN